MRPTRRPAPPVEPYRASYRGGAGRARELSITTLFRATTRTRSGETPVPYLRLSGRWLKQHGFTPGSRVTVTAEKGKLVSRSPPRRSAPERSTRNPSASTGDVPSPKIT